MADAIIYNEHGQILRVVSGPDDFLELQRKEGEFLLLGYTNNAKNYIDSEQNIVPFPEKPSEYHQWNWETKIYEISDEGVQESKKDKAAKIDEIRTNLSIQPITFDNKALDADTITVSVNLPGKLKELEARELLNQPIPVEQMFWKDADNNIHTWTDATVYRNWLLGYSIAIAERTTYFYAKAWQKKAEIEALTDINDILLYDTTTGW